MNIIFNIYLNIKTIMALDSSLNGFALEYVLLQIQDCLKLAYANGGKVFSGYVRDVLVQRQNDPYSHVEFRDVDIWFTKQEDANCFIKEMGPKLVPNNIIPFIKHDNNYTLSINNKFITHINIAVNVDVPVNDFDVNKLTYNGTWQSFSNKSVEELIGQIMKKECVMDKSYAEKLIDSYNNNSHVNEIEKNVQNRYLSKGWAVYIGGSGRRLPSGFNGEWCKTVVRNQLLDDPVVIDAQSVETTKNEIIKEILENLEKISTLLKKVLEL